MTTPRFIVLGDSVVNVDKLIMVGLRSRTRILEVTLDTGRTDATTTRSVKTFDTDLEAEEYIKWVAKILSAQTYVSSVDST